MLNFLLSRLVLPLVLTGLVFAAPIRAEETPAPAKDSSEEVPAAGYALQPGDVLAIQVWKEEGLSGEFLVRPDGGLSFPLAGEIETTGKSVPEVQKTLAERLAKYIPDPVVTVSLRNPQGYRVYVIGKVNRPGDFSLVRPVDIVQALAMAGGMNPFAAANDIKVLRRENGVPTTLPFRYGDIEDGKALEQNIVLQSGDVVVVP
jgi:polysaccharide export outer membrane protein